MQDSTNATYPEVQTPPTSGSLAVSIIITILALVIMLTNLLPMVAIMKYQWLKTNSNLLVFSLCVADFLFGPALIVYVDILGFMKTYSTWRWSVVYFFPIFFVCIGMSIISMFLMAADRFLAVVHPLSYKNIWSRQRVIIVLAGTWLYCTVLIFSVTIYFGLQTDVWVLMDSGLLGTVMPFEIFMGVLFSHGCLAFLLTLILYGVTSASLYKRSRNKNLLVGTRNSNGLEIEDKTKRATKMMLTLLGVLVLTWGPLLSITSVVNMRENENTAIRFLFMVFTFIFVSNFFVNPLLYPWMSREFRRAYKGLLRCKPSSVHPQKEDTSKDITVTYHA